MGSGSTAGPGEALEQDFTYAPITWNGVQWLNRQTTVTTKDLIRKTSYDTVYNYVPLYVYPAPNGTGGNSALAVESQVIYKDTTGTVIKTVTKGWWDQFSLGCEVDTIGSSGASSAVFYTYGTGDVVTDKKEYDYGLVGPSSCSNGAAAPTNVTPTRETVTAYQSFPPTTLSSTSILDAPCRVTVLAGGTTVSETDSYYDNGNSVCGTAGTPNVVAVSGLVSHDMGRRAGAREQT